MRALTRYNPHDPWMAPVAFDGPAIDGPKKVGFTRYMPRRGLSTETEAARDAAIDALKDAGYVLEEVELPNFDAMIKDADGCSYYRHRKTGQVQWRPPIDCHLGAPGHCLPTHTDSLPTIRSEHWASHVCERA